MLAALQAEITRIEGTQSATFASTTAFRAAWPSQVSEKTEAHDGAVENLTFAASEATMPESGSRSLKDEKPVKPLPGPVVSSRSLQDRLSPLGPTRGEARAWLSGMASADRQLGAAGLEIGGTHEIKPFAMGAAAGAGAMLGGTLAAHMVLAVGFALYLAARRPRNSQMTGARGREDRDGGGFVQSSGSPVSFPLAAADSAILFCATSDMMREIGRPYGPGIEALGLPRERLLIVEPRKEIDVLWALEEGLKSRAVAAVVGCFAGSIALTPARRLALAAQSFGVPSLLVTSGAAPSVASTSSRWRVAALQGAAHRWDPQAPGGVRRNVVLEKLKSRVLTAPETPSLGCEQDEEDDSFEEAAAGRRREQP